MSFGKWLRGKLYDKRVNNAELARRVGVSATHIGNLVRDYSPNTKSGVARPTIELTDKIAIALGIPKDEARLAAGYAPSVLPRSGPPETLEELVEIVEAMGITNLQFFDHDKLRNATPEQLQEVLEAIEVAMNVTIARQMRERPTDDRTDLRAN